MKEKYFYCSLQTTFLSYQMWQNVRYIQNDFFPLNSFIALNPYSAGTENDWSWPPL